MGCYRIWLKNGTCENVHGVRIGIEMEGDSLVLEPEHAVGDDADRLHGFIFEVAGGARLPAHEDCPGETDYMALMEKFCGPR